MRRISLASSLNRHLEASHNMSGLEESRDEIGEVGVSVDINIKDGRLNLPESRTILRVEQVDDAGELFCVRLETNHHAFSRGKSVTIRPLHTFYSLQRLLTEQHLYTTSPSLPP